MMIAALPPIPYRDPRVAAGYHRMLELLAGSSYETHPAVLEARKLASHRPEDSCEAFLRFPLPDCALEDPDQSDHGELLTLMAAPDRLPLTLARRLEAAILGELEEVLCATP